MFSVILDVIKGYICLILISCFLLVVFSKITTILGAGGIFLSIAILVFLIFTIIRRI